MQVQNVECQLARAQLSRYVAGDVLPEETLAELEAHLASCPDCREVAAKHKELFERLSEQQQAAPATQPEEGEELPAMPADLEVPEPEPVPPAFASSEAEAASPEPKPKAKSKEARPRRSRKLALDSEKAEAEEPEVVLVAAKRSIPWRRSLRTAGLAVGLFAVLAAMSFVGSNLSQWIGGKGARLPATQPGAEGKASAPETPPESAAPAAPEAKAPEPSAERATLDALAAGLPDPALEKIDPVPLAPARSGPAAREAEQTVRAMLAPRNSSSNAPRPASSPPPARPERVTAPARTASASSASSPRITRPSAPRRPAPRSVRPSVRPRSSDSIVVYGPDGRPLEP